MKQNLGVAEEMLRDAPEQWIGSENVLDGMRAIVEEEGLFDDNTGKRD